MSATYTQAGNVLSLEGSGKKLCCTRRERVFIRRELSLMAVTFILVL